MSFLKGGIPYVDFVEKKPPLIYAFYFLIFKIFGSGNMIAVHVVTALWVWATALVMAQIARLFLSKERAPLAGVFYLVSLHLMPATEVLATNCEILLNLPLSLAVYAVLAAVVKKRSSLMFWSGLFTALATLFKHQAASFCVVAVLFFVVLALGESTQKIWYIFKRTILFCAGFFLPIAILVGIYFQLGHLRELYEWNVLFNVVYLDVVPPLKSVISRGVVNSLGFIFANIFLMAIISKGIFVLHQVKCALIVPGITWGQFLFFVLCWFVFTFLSVCLGWRFYGHYYIQLVPVVSLSAGILYWALIDRDQKIKGERGLVVLTIVLLVAWQVVSFVSTQKHLYEGARTMHARIGTAIQKHTLPDQRIFVWGNYAYAYTFGQRAPASRFITCEYLVPYWARYFGTTDKRGSTSLLERQWQALSEDFERHPPALIVDVSSSEKFKDWHAFKMTHFSFFETLRQQSYQIVDVIDGVTLYARLPE